MVQAFGKPTFTGSQLTGEPTCIITRRILRKQKMPSHMDWWWEQRESVVWKGTSRKKSGTSQNTRRKKYPRDLLDRTEAIVSNLNRNDLLTPIQKEDKKQIRLITNYNPNNPDLHKIITEHTRLLERTRKKTSNLCKMQQSKKPTGKNKRTHPSNSLEPTLLQMCHLPIHEKNQQHHQ